MKRDPAVAMVAGVGPGLGTALCQTFLASGYRVASLARTPAAAAPLARQFGPDAFRPFTCDLTDADSVGEAFSRLEQAWEPASVLIYNAGEFLAKPIGETSVEAFDHLWAINCRGAFLCASRAATTMLQRGSGTIIFSGATAGVKAAAHCSAFGSSKFALRGLAQALARELAPRGVHVAHVVIDGILWTPRTQGWPGVEQQRCLDPDAVAETYLHLVRQHRSAWTLELDLRPDVEPF